ncbi:hypothetical protein MTER_21810 [Mycolicibacter terrae]|uniref:Uncharacterized protein n=1 Tax=Mycolicibacter terrae TaxID=1788 RepID=A0AAD1HYA7_9MYCO|nr:hypothetical protein MTER_21810 [Mycolicibacter terrae]
MGQRPGRLHALLFQGDGGGFGLPDPDRQVSIAVGFTQQQHGLVLRLLDANTDYAYFTHLQSALRILPMSQVAVFQPDSLRNPGWDNRMSHNKPPRRV